MTTHLAQAGRILLLALALGLGAVAPLPALAGDEPDIPQRKLTEAMPALLEQRTETAALHERLCPAGQAPAAADFLEATNADALAQILKRLRRSAKDLAAHAEWLISYQEKLHYYDGEQRAGFQAAIDHARKLEPQLAALRTEVKTLRTALRKVSADDAASAVAACEALGAVRTTLDAVEPGVFAK